MVQAYYNHPADITEYTVAGLSGHRNLELLTLGPGSKCDSGWDAVTAVSSQMTPCG
jgi:hypothetical protein